MGTVTGPSSSVDGDIVLFSGTSGTVVQDSGCHLVSNDPTNIFVGNGAGASITTGLRNVSIGQDTLGDLTQAADNVAIGQQALSVNVNSGQNTAIGSFALFNYTNTVAGNNTAVGYSALHGSSALTGTGNTAVGVQTGVTITSGTDNTFLGNSADASTNNLTNATALGNSAIVTASDTVQIGNLNVTAVNFGNSGTTLGTDLVLAGNPSASGTFSATKFSGSSGAGVELQGTNTNNNASAGDVGEYIYADSGGSAAGTVTMTIASPAVITWSGRRFSLNNGTVPVVFSTTGSLPTGITAGTTYWIIPSSVSGNTFKIATSIANAFAGTAVNTSGSQSGTHTALCGVSIPAAFVNIAAIQLTPGDWEACGTIFFSPDSSSTTTLGTGAQIGSASAANQGFPNAGMLTYWPFSWSGASGMVLIAPTGTGRISVSSTTIYYLIGVQNISAGSSHGYGFVGARRVR